MASSREPHKERKKKRKRDEHLSQSPKSKKQRPVTSESRSIEPRPVANDSPFYLQKSSLYLPLSPISYLYPLEGLCAEHLSPLILTYYPPFHGVIISYSNPRLSEDPRRADEDTGGPVLAKSVDEYAVSFVWVTADFLIFRPRQNQRITGWVNLQSEGHIGLVCWNLFNASIERKRLPKGWKWVGEGAGKVHPEDGMVEETDGEAEGYYVDKKGRKVEGQLEFIVMDCETIRDRDKGFLSIVGTLLKEDVPHGRRS
jgi:DNA-directed RNA polymerase I subunit RPA43